MRVLDNLVSTVDRVYANQGSDRVLVTFLDGRPNQVLVDTKLSRTVSTSNVLVLQRLELKCLEVIDRATNGCILSLCDLKLAQSSLSASQS